MAPESQLDRIERKMDSLDTKIDSMATTQARHDERIKAVESSQEKQGGKLWAVVAMVLSGFLGGITGKLFR
jgi:prefoldin subunit 5